MVAVSRRSNRERNIVSLLARLRSMGTASRSDLADSIGVDRSTMTHLVSALLDAGLVEPVAQAPSGSRGGRRAELLSIDRSRFAVGGCDIRSTGARWLLADLHGRRLASGAIGPSLPAASAAVRRAWLEAILDDLRAAILDAAGVRSGHPSRTVLGVGAALPGLFDVERTVLLNSFELGLTDAPVRDLWGAAGPPLLLSNDATSYAWHEIEMCRAESGASATGAGPAGDASADADGLYAYTKLHRDGAKLKPTGLGVGVMVVEGGRILRGARGARGELRGYRWTASSADQLGRDLERIRALSGERAAARAAAAELVRNLLVVASVLDPARIVIAGDLGAYACDVEREVCRLTGRHGCPVIVRPPDDDAVSKGAANMVLSGLFSADRTAADVSLARLASAAARSASS